MATLTRISERPERVAVLLNANAKAVDDHLRREIARFVPSEDVYYSRSLADARAIAATVVAKGYDTVLTGGGDGTFVGYLSELRDAADGSRGGSAVVTRGGAALHLAPEPAPLPKFGVLHLGTGNALAHTMGASASRVGVVEDVLRARRSAAGTRPLSLVRCKGRSAPFAGTGIDGKILNDYAGLRDSMGRTPLRPMFTGGTGYFMAIAFRTVPTTLLERSAANVVIYNEGGPARQIAPDGRPVGQPIARGEIIYQGECRIASCSTIPYCGYGFTLFPHAMKAPGKMQLRISALDTLGMLKIFRQIWKGRTPAGVLDFHVDRVRLEFDRPMPLQVGGDAEGYSRTIEMSLDRDAVEMLDFRAKA